MPPGDFAPVFIVSLMTLVTGAVLIFRGPVGKAIARRLEGGAGSSELEARVAELEHRVEAMQVEREELLGRIEFAERLLVDDKPSPRELR